MKKVLLVLVSLAALAAIAGVCAGVAEYFGLDVSLVRIATLLLILFGGLSLWVYIILWLIVPKAPKRLKS